MKLEAVYGPEDFLELVKADIAAKGYSLIGELGSEDFIDCAVSISVEQKQTVKVEPRHYKPREVTEKEAARREQAGKRLREINQARVKNKPTEPALGTIDKTIPVDVVAAGKKAVALPIERPLSEPLPV